MGPPRSQLSGEKERQADGQFSCAGTGKREVSRVATPGGLSSAAFRGVDWEKSHSGLAGLVRKILRRKRLRMTFRSMKRPIAACFNRREGSGLRAWFSADGRKPARQALEKNGDPAKKRKRTDRILIRSEEENGTPSSLLDGER